MSEKNKNRICPVKCAKILDSTFRKFLQNPRKLLKPFIKDGMTVLDVGCGPGFFSIELAKLVGKSGTVIAADLQGGMLEIVKKKIRHTEFENIISLHKCEENKIGVVTKADFILVFYMFHEVPEKENFLQELKSILKPDGRIYMTEPRFHVSKIEFLEIINLCKKIGFEVVEEPKIFLSRAVILKKLNE